MSPTEKIAELEQRLRDVVAVCASQEERIERLEAFCRSVVGAAEKARA